MTKIRLSWIKSCAFKNSSYVGLSVLSLLRWLGQSSEVECNPKTSISFFDDLESLFLNFCWLSSLRSLGQSSEVEHNWKMSISFFDDLGGLFLHFGQLSSLRSLSQSSEVERNPKMSISFFNDSGDLFLHFGWLSLLRSLSRSSEVEFIPKMRIFHWLRGPFFAFWSTFVAYCCIWRGIHCQSPMSLWPKKQNVTLTLIPTFQYGGGGYISQNQNVTLTWNATTWHANATKCYNMA